MTSSDTLGKLSEITKELGLLPSEQQEFLQYWTPRIEALHSPYIFFSLISTSDKKLIDDVEISPKPDTRIEFLIYIQPMQANTYVTPLEFPKVPQRKGFTEVEWGGILNTSEQSPFLL